MYKFQKKFYLSVGFGEGLQKELHQESKRLDISMSAVIRRALVHYFGHADFERKNFKQEEY